MQSCPCQTVLLTRFVTTCIHHVCAGRHTTDTRKNGGYRPSSCYILRRMYLARLDRCTPRGHRTRHTMLHAPCYGFNESRPSDSVRPTTRFADAGATAHAPQPKQNIYDERTLVNIHRKSGPVSPPRASTNPRGTGTPRGTPRTVGAAEEPRSRLWRWRILPITELQTRHERHNELHPHLYD